MLGEPTWTELDQTCVDLDHHWPRPGQVWPTSGEFGGNRPNPANYLLDVDQLGPSLARIINKGQHVSCEVSPILGHRVLVMNHRYFSEFSQRSADF